MSMRMHNGLMLSNLESFLHCTTPFAPSHFLPKREINRLWHPWAWEREEDVEYFKLAQLWSSCFDEWSAYGAGIPIRLDTGETLLQYYVPYLSAIQIFTNSPPHFIREETESVSEARDSLSDESESDKLSRSDGYSSEEGAVEQECLSRTKDRLGYLYFQHFERSTPYRRVPFMDKVNGLAERYPGLMSLRSVDLSPASWMAVAWYPIYHIPMGRTIKDLSTCFLTFHTLSSSFQDMDLDNVMENSCRKRKEGESIPLPPFGLATYKMQGDIWISNSSGRDQQRLLSLFSVADSWLKQLGVQHHDFNYFTSTHRA